MNRFESAALFGIKSCVFDAYGTLFDVHSAVASHRSRLGADADGISALWRSKQLEYTWLRSLMGHHADFWRVTADALDFALGSFGVSDSALRNDLLDAYLRLDCYSEVPSVLKTLKGLGLPLAILSNGSPAMLKSAVQGAGIENLLDGVWSVEEVGIFKPSSEVYRLATAHLNLAAEQIAFMSSNGWDCAGAAAFGFQVAWINRFGQNPERLPFGPKVELKTLSELPQVLAP